MSDSMRLTDADRERLIDQLSQHAVAGRLTIEELERRIDVVGHATTHEEAAAAMAGLPPLSPGAPRRSFGSSRPHGQADAPAPEWQPTPERFRDPRSGRVMRVWVDGSGARHYVPDATGET